MASNNKELQTTFLFKGRTYQYFDLSKFSQSVKRDLKRLPYSIRVLLEGCLRNAEKNGFSEEHAEAVINWSADPGRSRPAVPFLPARVLMQDYTGVPVLNDLTALRAAVQRDGKNPHVVNPRIPSNLVIDHSLQVNTHGCAEARRINELLEFDQNFERYQFLKWSQSAYDNLQVLPPGLGICHQVNLEYLGQVAFVREMPDGTRKIYPDSVLGTDSHTTMINGLGVMGWGVGGIEALAAMLEYPSEFPIPDVIGVHLIGSSEQNAASVEKSRGRMRYGSSVGVGAMITFETWVAELSIDSSVSTDSGCIGCRAGVHEEKAPIPIIMLMLNIYHLVMTKL